MDLLLPWRFLDRSSLITHQARTSKGRCHVCPPPGISSHRSSRLHQTCPIKPTRLRFQEAGVHHSIQRRCMTKENKTPVKKEQDSRTDTSVNTSKMCPGPLGPLQPVETVVVRRPTGARLIAFSPNPDNPDWSFYGTLSPEGGVRDVKSDPCRPGEHGHTECVSVAQCRNPSKFDIELIGDRVKVTSRKTGSYLISQYEWVLFS